MEEVAKIDASHQILGFGEYSERTYGEVVKKRPTYVEYLMNGRAPDRLDVEQFAEWGKWEMFRYRGGER